MSFLLKILFFVLSFSLLSMHIVQAEDLPLIGDQPLPIKAKPKKIKIENSEKTVKHHVKDQTQKRSKTRQEKFIRKKKKATVVNKKNNKKTQNLSKKRQKNSSQSKPRQLKKKSK